MALFINKRLRIERDRIIHVRRVLPGKGKILVVQGQEVTPEDIIGRSTVSAGFRVVQLADLLSVPSRDALKYLQRPIGQKIYRGELLAFKKSGLMSSQKIVTSPTDGLISSYDDKTGILKIEFLKAESDLASAVFGVIDKVDRLRNEVVIRTQATIIYGLLGSGKTREGVLNFLDGRSDLVDRKGISKAFAGNILVTGGLIYSGALVQAITFGVHGIITGGINASDFQGVSGGRIIKIHRVGTDIGLSLLVTEGFGSAPIGEDIYAELLKFKNRFAILEGNRNKLILPSNQNSSMTSIKKVSLPLDDVRQMEGVNEPLAIELKVGLKIRVVSTPYLGEQGLVVAIDHSPSKLNSGVSTYLVTIQTRTRKIRIPYTNIEAID